MDPEKSFKPELRRENTPMLLESIVVATLYILSIAAGRTPGLSLNVRQAITALEAIGINWYSDLVMRAFALMTSSDVASNVHVAQFLARSFSEAVESIQRIWEKDHYLRHLIWVNSPEVTSTRNFFDYLKKDAAALILQAPEEILKFRLDNTRHNDMQSVTELAELQISSLINTHLQWLDPRFKEFMISKIPVLVQTWVDLFGKYLGDSEQFITRVEMAALQRLILQTELSHRQAVISGIASINDQLAAVVSKTEELAEMSKLPQLASEVAPSTTFSRSDDADRFETPKHDTVAYIKLRPPSHDMLIGREVQFQKLRRLLSSDRPRVISIEGTGGVGKSALALEAAYYYQKNYHSLPENERFKSIIWVSAQSQELVGNTLQPRLKQEVNADLEDICHQVIQTFDHSYLQPGTDETSEAIRLLGKYRTLLIIDNLDEIKDPRVQAFINSVPSPTKVLITSRYPLSFPSSIKLEPLEERESLKLIKHEWGLQGGQEAFLPKQQTELYGYTGGLPLVIRWAIAQMVFGGGVKSTLNRFQELSGDVVEFCLLQSIETLEPLALTILTSVALIPNFVPVRDIAELLGVENHDAFKMALNSLDKLALVDRKLDTLIISSVTREFIIRRTPELELLGIKTRIDDLNRDYVMRIKNLLATSRSSSIKGVYELANLLSEEAYTIAQKNGDLWWVKISLEHLFNSAKRQWENVRAERLNQELLRVHENLDAPLSKAIANDQRALILSKKGQIEEAFEPVQISIELKKAIGDKSGLVHSFAQMAELYLRLGDLDRARLCIEESLNYSKKIHSKNSGKHARRKYLHSRAYAYTVRGDIEIKESPSREAEALICYEEALRLKKLDGRPEEIVRTLGIIGNIKMRRGDREGAKEAFLGALDISKQRGYLAGIGESLERLAGVAIDEGRISDAIELCEDAWAVNESVGSQLSKAQILSKRARCSEINGNYILTDKYISQLQYVDKQVASFKVTEGLRRYLCQIARSQNNTERELAHSIALLEYIPEGKGEYLGTLHRIVTLLLEKKKHKLAKTYLMEGIVKTLQLKSSELKGFVNKSFSFQSDSDEFSKRTFFEDFLKAAKEVGDEAIREVIDTFIGAVMDSARLSEITEYIETAINGLGLEYRSILLETIEKVVKDYSTVSNYHRERYLAYLDWLLRYPKPQALKMVESLLGERLKSEDFHHALGYFSCLCSFGDVKFVRKQIGRMNEIAESQERENLHMAELYRERLVSIARDLGDTNLLSSMLEKAINVSSKLGSYTSLKAYAEENLKLLEGGNSLGRKPIALYTFGYAAYMTNDYSIAFENLSRFAKEYGNLRDKRVSHAHFFLALLLMKSNPSEARDQLQSCLNIRNNLNLPQDPDLAAVLFHLGQVFANLGDNALSEYYYRQCVEVYTQLHQIGASVSVLETLADQSILNGDREKGKGYLHECLEHADEIALEAQTRIRRKIKSLGSY
jgi:tetratricopeptide (TPR) repeat protein